MHNTQRASKPANQAALGQITASPGVAAVTVASNTDHIITISTASITEVHTDEDTEQLKQHHLEEQKSKLVHFEAVALRAPNVVTPAESAAAISQPAPAATHIAKHKLRALCQLSQVISFQNNIADVHHRRGRRLHGLQLPLHPLQLFGWLVLVLFGLASYCVLIPAFSATLQGPLYGLISGLYVVHIASHLAALLTDPADKELRRVHRNDRIVPEFDRAKHAHVIENGRCHLCNIRTSSPRTKHCSVCNKCVGKFDHHCKWLNHCIGSRNYVAFLMCVVSAVVATLVIVAAVIAQIVLYYVQPEWLSFYWCSATGDINDEPMPVRDITIGSLDMDALNVAARDQNAGAVFNGTDFINLTLSLGNGTLMLLEEEQQEQQQHDDALYADVENATLATTVIDNLTTLIQETLTKPTAVTTLATTTEASNHTASPAVAGISVNETIFLALIGLLGLLAAISAGLLLHLCFFHIYISFLGLTTYEYIRNHRQAQEARAKQLLSNNGTLHANSSTLPKNGAVAVHFSPTQLENNRNPSKQSNDCAQLYCCASVRHPNVTADVSDSSFKSAESEPSQQVKLHCCANSREYHQRSSKAYYVCSLLEERSASPNSLSNLAHHLASGVGPYDAGSASFGTAADDVEQQQLRTFHCCSSFAATALQRRVSAATTKATLIGDVEAAAAAASLSSGRARSYLQYTEQCTFCTFRIRSPLIGAKRNSAASNSTRTLASQPTNMLRHSAGGTSTATIAAEREHQRCCMKSISKNQRWRRKWNCCASVPDSPDVPNDLIAALAYRHQQAEVAAKVNSAELPVQFIRTLNGSSSGADGSPRSAASGGTLKSQSAATTRTRNARTWPVARLRHMLRMLGRYRRPRCQHHHHGNAGAAGVAAAEQQHNHHGMGIRQNQIRPLQLQSRHINGGCYYDSSTPQPSSSGTPTASELSSGERDASPTIYSSSEGSATPANNELILPTSIIRDDSVTTYTLTLPPALPPPTRRKMPNPTDLEELAETLGFVSHPSGPSMQQQQQHQQRLPALNNVYRRQRRKHFLRTRSPTLSPIHESGLSNPTSPQPCRHNSAACSPAVARSSTLVNNLCGIAGEALRKAASNSSLQSVSSNSSST